MRSLTLQLSAFLLLILMVATQGCTDDNMDGFPITNDFRILQVKVGDDVVTSGVEGVFVQSEFTFVCSHSIDADVFEGNLQLEPSASYSISYDASNSIVTLTFDEPLEYESSYSFSLPQGTYGSEGQSSTEAFAFDFTTASFESPNVSLTADRNAFFETEMVTITASIAEPILREVTMDVVFSGSAVEGEDFTSSANSIVIPAGSTSASIELTALSDQDLEGEENILITLENLVNGVQMTPQEVSLTLGDLPPQIEFKGVMSFKIGGTSNNGRAIHLRVLEDIADLSEYGVGIANNGGGSDGREIDFPAISVSAGDDVLLVRDIDRAGIEAYFGSFFADYDHVVESGGLNFNGDDPFELYRNDIVIETYGDVELDGTGLEWEWTGSWAYKLNGVWEYAGVDCSANSTTTFESNCPYPFCVPMQIQGALALLWDGSGTNGGKAVHLRANRAIDDLSAYGLGVANNGGGTDGLEVNLPSGSVAEGAQILIAREPATIGAYFGSCIDLFDQVIQSDGMNQNGDDAIELFFNMNVIETYGDADVDGTGQFWEYAGSWGYKVGGAFTYGGVDCASASTSTQTSACPYPLCN
jgi:hypothetical protein